MKSIRLLAIVSIFLLACLGISGCRQQQQVHKPDSMKMSGTFFTTTESTYPNDSPLTTAERRAENITIEKGTLTCTADTALFIRETGQIRLIGNVVVRTADGIEITAEEAVFASYSPVEISNTLAR